MRFQAPRGTHDVLPSESHRWQRLEREFLDLARIFGYREIRTPAFEDTDLFVRSSGETSDIVSKQMYSFLDKGDRNITLKPEGTAPALRAIIEHNLVPQGTVGRFCYVTPIFRYERPQKGRYRQAHQVGLELLGSASPAADAEVIELTARFYETIGIGGIKVLLNSLGDDEARAHYRAALLEYAQPLLKDESEDVRQRMERNPLRLLDSKDEKIQEALKSAPKILEFLSDDSKFQFATLQELLHEANVPFEIAPEIVRGLDYYTNTVFEVQSTLLGAQSALCGGGRYDNLVKELGGAPTPSVGVGMGIERALLVLEESQQAWEAELPEVYVVTAASEALPEARALVRELRAAGVHTFTDIDGKKMAAQLKQADKSGARRAIIVGPDESARGVVVLRDLATGQQTDVAKGQVLQVLRESA